jgi:hypothetical protein
MTAVLPCETIAPRALEGKDCPFLHAGTKWEWVWIMRLRELNREDMPVRKARGSPGTGD